MIGDRITVKKWKDPRFGWNADWTLYRFWVIKRWDCSLGADTEARLDEMIASCYDSYQRNTLIPNYAKLWPWSRL